MPGRESYIQMRRAYSTYSCLYVYCIDCNVTRYSRDYPSKNGTLHSPNYPGHYPSNLRCVFYVIGLPTERVQLRFTDFNVKGIPSRYVDKYKFVNKYTHLDTCVSETMMGLTKKYKFLHKYIRLDNELGKLFNDRAIVDLST